MRQNLLPYWLRRWPRRRGSGIGDSEGKVAVGALIQRLNQLDARGAQSGSHLPVANAGVAGDVDRAPLQVITVRDANTFWLCFTVRRVLVTTPKDDAIRAIAAVSAGVADRATHGALESTKAKHTADL